MMPETFIQIELARINSLVADKQMEVAKANRELSLGGWLHDHAAACLEIDRAIEHHFVAILQS